MIKSQSRKCPWQPTAFLRLNLSHKISLKTFVDLDTRREFCLSVLSKSAFFIVHKYAFSRQEVFNVLWLNQYQISSIPRPTQSSVKDLKIDSRYSALQIYAQTSNRNCTKMQFTKLCRWLNVHISKLTRGWKLIKPDVHHSPWHRADGWNCRAVGSLCTVPLWSSGSWCFWPAVMWAD